MFGNNEITGKKFFRNSKDDELLVTSRFFTLQGEGPYRGHPAYFIRLAKCNLACSFCDTDFDVGDWMNFDHLLTQADEVIADYFQQNLLERPSWTYGPNNKIVLVVTGGEPTLQHNLAAFLSKAQHKFSYTQIESNGILALANLPASTTLVVSPKCLEKNGQAIHYLTPNSQVLARADCLKFVLSSPQDPKYLAYSEIPQWAHEWAANTGKPVFVSPLNIYKRQPLGSKQVQNQDLTLAERSDINELVSFWEPELLDLDKNKYNHEYAAKYCLKYGFIFNLQIHLFASLP